MSANGKSVREIAGRIGMSPATVHRALNNCGNVDVETKRAVWKMLRTLEAEGEELPQSPRSPIGLLTPAKPHFFWDKAHHGMRAWLDEHRGVEPAVAFCSDMGAAEDYGYCLDALQRRGVQACVVVPGTDPLVLQRLREWAQSCRLVFLCEWADIPGVYVGGDPVADGTRFARACAPLLGAKPRILVADTAEKPVSAARTAAFLAACEQLCPGSRAVGRVEIEGERPDQAAFLARELDSRFRGAFDAVYAAQGILPQVASALKKLGLAGKVRLVGCELSPNNGPYVAAGAIHAVLEQNIARQAAAALDAALALQKGEDTAQRIYIPSRIHIYT